MRQAPASTRIWRIFPLSLTVCRWGNWGLQKSGYLATLTPMWMVCLERCRSGCLWNLRLEHHEYRLLEHVTSKQPDWVHGCLPAAEACSEQLTCSSRSTFPPSGEGPQWPFIPSRRPLRPVLLSLQMWSRPLITFLCLSILQRACLARRDSVICPVRSPLSAGKRLCGASAQLPPGPWPTGAKREETSWGCFSVFLSYSMSTLYFFKILFYFLNKEYICMIQNQNNIKSWYICTYICVCNYMCTCSYICMYLCVCILHI